MEANVIHSEDWPAVSSLIQRERAGQFAGLGNGPGSAVGAVPTRFAVLTKEVIDGVAEAALMIPSERFTQDVFTPDGLPFHLTIGEREGAGDVEKTGDLQAGITRQELLSVLETTSLQGQIERVEFDGPRWKVVYKSTRPAGARILSDPDQERLFVSANHLVSAGEKIRVKIDLMTAGDIPAGTMVQVVSVPGKGWAVTELEEFQAAGETTIIGGDPYTYADECTRQILPAGVSSDCPACGDDTPEGFSVSFPGQSSPEFLKLLYADLSAQDSEGIDTSDPIQNRQSLLHDAGSVFESDAFNDGSMYWHIEIFDNADSGPSARLELCGTDETIYSDGLKIVYWTKGVFDCLSANSLSRVSHLSKGSAAMGRHEFPPCVTVTPFAHSCRPKSGAHNAAFNCVAYWSAILDGQELIAGPAVNDPDDGERDCVWSPYEAAGTSMTVGFYWTGIESLNVARQVRFTAEVEIVRGDDRATYRLTQRGDDRPSCFGMTLQKATGGDTLPGTITIRPWQK
ncbi:hypothetical protein [Thalassoglobus polymorphus]|uniref:Uncharacterized protein n=1 Tax=Thalassoglobus polymorphus TaxID=2527994 RepID=A0A517QHA1_9PLAN|nr:hypothetical protein [Thalassoglobus polymorphus]QDT30941.1 hypothetical protein Mal48_01700 [Thalassoglobus polymorphus]QDT30985.1 hypothetical protein Mal48_02140 [Thalassoglobus polymorphus]